MAENNRRSSRGELGFSKSTRVSGVLGDFGQLLNGVSERYQRQASLFRGMQIVEKTKKLRKKKAVLAAEGLILKKLTLKSDKKRVKKVFLELRGAFEELTAKKK